MDISMGDRTPNQNIDLDEIMQSAGVHGDEHLDNTSQMVLMSQD